jgi:iron complex transport system substrate-binding protein
MVLRCAPLIAFMVSGCSAAPTIAPQSIVSNNPCIDAILAEVARPGQIAAVSQYSHSPDSGSAPLNWAKAHPALGQSAEEIIAAKPRLVLTGNLASTGTNDALRRAGIHLVTLGVPATIEDNIAQVRTIAKAIDREHAGEALAMRIEVAVAPTDLPREAPTAIIWQSGGFVAGKGTIQDAMLSRAGFTNASAAYGLNQWDVLPLETLIRQPPKVIFTAKPHPMFALLKGTKVVTFPDKMLFCGGPTLIEAMRIMRGART